MFGVLYAAFNLLFGAAARIDEDIDNNRRKNKAKNENKLIYSDHNNQDRLIENDRLVYKTTKGTDKVLVDLYSGKIYYNYTKENENIKISEAKSNNKTVIRNVYFYRNIHDYRNKIWYKCNILPEYKDINTGLLYVVLKINGIDFYMDVDSGHIMRPTDEEDLNNKKNNISIKNIIDVFNKSQDLLKQDIKFSQIWWVKSEFYLDGYKKITIDENLNIIKEKK